MSDERSQGKRAWACPPCQHYERCKADEHCMWGIPQRREPDTVRTAYPKVVSTTLIMADGSMRRLRILDLLYYRLGVTSIHDIEKAYEGERPL